MRSRLLPPLALLLFLAAVPAASAAGFPIAEGTLAGPSGAPSAGSVTAYAFTPGSGTMLPLASARTGRAGRFALAASRTGALERLARANGGWATVMVEARTTRGTTTRFFSRHVGGVPFAQLASANMSSRVPRLALRATAPLGGAGAPPPAGSARAARGCHLGTTTKRILQRHERLTTIGELNNAYADTTVSFTYGQRADSAITSSISFGTAGFHLGGSVEIASSSAAGSAIGTVIHGRFSKRIRSYFTYYSYKVYDCGLNGPTNIRYVVLPIRWYGTLHYAALSGGLHRCPADGKHLYVGGQTFSTSTERAHTWKRASSFGFSFHGFTANVGANATSGFSQYVQVHMRFGGSRHRRHYICGAGGGSPISSDRLLSGAT